MYTRTYVCIYKHTYVREYKFGGLIVMLWHTETLVNPQRNDKLSWTHRGSNSLPPDWGSTASCNYPAHSPHATEIVKKKQNPNNMSEAILDNWQPVWNAQVSISTSVCISFELRPDSSDTHICWFKLYTLAQGNVYKSTKEQIKYRGHTETGWQAGRQLLFWMDETCHHATVHWQQDNVIERIAWWVWA